MNPQAADAVNAAVSSAFAKFICKACGLIYDEALGDADSGIAPGTRFADIPDDWSCPLCGVGKSDFEPYDDTPLERVVGARAPGTARARRGRPGVVIVGAGRAGWQMADALRRRDATLPITIVTACSGDVYDKPLLSVAHARGIASDGLVKEAGNAAARRLGVRLLARTDAVRVSARDRVLRTSRGRVAYDHLVLAHGAAPREVASLPATLCWRINHLDAYRRLQQSLVATPHGSPVCVAIVGAGLVGCELANDLALAGHAVTLLDPHERPLAHWLSATQSAELLAAWATLPLTYVGSVQVTGVVAEGDARRVLTASGVGHTADHVVAAIGLDTPSRLCRSAGLAWNHGIAVDPVTLRTSDLAVHALGDCISIDGAPVRYIEPIARQAAVIADTITGRPTSGYAGRPVPVRIKTTSREFTV